MKLHHKVTLCIGTSELRQQVAAVCSTFFFGKYRSGKLFLINHFHLLQCGRNVKGTFQTVIGDSAAVFHKIVKAFLQSCQQSSYSCQLHFRGIAEFADICCEIIFFDTKCPLRTEGRQHLNFKIILFQKAMPFEIVCGIIGGA